MKKRGGVAVQRTGVSTAVRRDVRILMAAQSASTFGSFITRAALPLLAIIGLGISAEEAAIIAGVDLIAATLASQIAGVWIDRLPRRAVMIAADLLRALLLASIPIAAFMTGGVSLFHLILVSAASGAVSYTHLTLPTKRIV